MSTKRYGGYAINQTGWLGRNGCESVTGRNKRPSETPPSTMAEK